MRIATPQAFDEFRHGAHLVAAHLEVADELELIVDGGHG
jgi:hypothetical protein